MREHAPPPLLALALFISKLERQRRRIERRCRERAALVSRSGRGHKLWLMPYDSDMDQLTLLAGEARKKDAWFEFSRFCELRGHGVRAEAMERLNEFMRAAACWSFEERMAFSRWVLWHSREFRDDRIVVPHSLREQFIIPTLRHWCETSSGEAEPRLWLGLLRCDDPSHHLEEALELDPSCELARQTLTRWILWDVDYNQHELPSFYIDDPANDLRELERASKLASGSTAEAWAMTVQQEIAGLRARAEDAVAAQGRAPNVVPFPGAITGRPSDR
jgi:hypothetical protein